MNEDFLVPKEYQKLLKKIQAKEEMTKRDFIDLALLAIKLSDKYWNNRQGLAFYLAGMLAHPIIQKDLLLNKISCLFGELELPDYHAAGTENDVKKKWNEVKKLVLKATMIY